MTILGAATGQFLPTSLSAGDITGDGVADLILGASLGTGPAQRSEAGLTYIVEGGPKPMTSLDLAAGDQLLTVAGPDAGDRLGGATTVADLSGDGRAELILLAAMADGPKDAQPDVGEVYVLEAPTD
jgi:hypothetical protein